MLKNLDQEKMVKIISICLGVAILSVFALSLVHGQALEPLIPPRSVGGARELPRWITMLVNILASVAGIVAVFFLIFSGYKYVTAGGDAEAAGAARTGILNAILGLVVILAAWALVRWLLQRLVGTSELEV